MKTLFVLLFALMLLAGCSHTNKKNYTPLSLSERIFSKEPFPEIEKYSAGEYKGRPNGQDLAKSATSAFSLLNQTDTSAVVDITVMDSIGRASDAYLYFKKDSTWKVTAFRALALTGMMENLLQQLEAMAQAQTDSATTLPNGNLLSKPKQDYHNMQENMKLMLSADNNLVAHFNKNKQAFEKLKDDLITRGVMQTSGLKDMQNADDLNTAVNALYLSGVHTDGEGTGKYLNFLIGGITDNSVGYLYIQNEKNVPQMSPSDFILIRKIGNGWYLYKTT